MVYRKTKASEDRKEARRRLFLDAAIKLFGKHGYHATTVPMMVAEAASSTGCFYLYFRNKEDVFKAALEELGGTINRLMEDVERSDSDPLKRISTGLEVLFLYLAEQPEQARILIVESSGLAPEIDRARRAILEDQEEHVRRTLESAPEVFAVEDATIAARCMVGAGFEAICRWLEENPQTRTEASHVARVVARFTTRAVKKVLPTPRDSALQKARCSGGRD